MFLVDSQTFLLFMNNDIFWSKSQTDVKKQPKTLQDLPCPLWRVSLATERRLSLILEACLAKAYGAFNVRQVGQKKVIVKDDSQKARIREVLAQCWMFTLSGLCSFFGVY